MKPPIDIVRDVIERLMAHDDSITQALALRVELEVRREWGGQTVTVAKSQTYTGRTGRPPTLSVEAARKAHADGLTAEPTAVLTKRHGISRTTLYRLMKKGPPPAEST